MTYTDEVAIFKIIRMEKILIIFRMHHFSITGLYASIMFHLYGKLE